MCENIFNIVINVSTFHIQFTAFEKDFSKKKAYMNKILVAVNPRFTSHFNSIRLKILTKKNYISNILYSINNIKLFHEFVKKIENKKWKSFFTYKSTGT